MRLPPLLLVLALIHGAPAVAQEAPAQEPDVTLPDEGTRPLDLGVYASPAWQPVWALMAATAVPSLLVLAIPVAGPAAYLATRMVVPLVVPLPGDHGGVSGRWPRARRFILRDLAVHGVAAVVALVGGVVLGGVASGALVLSAFLFPFTVCLPYCVPAPQFQERNLGSVAYAVMAIPVIMFLVGTGVCLGSTCAAQGVTPVWTLWPGAASPALNTDEELEAP